MSNKLGMSTSKGYNDKFAEVSSKDFGIGTIIISDYSSTVFVNGDPKIFTKEKLTFYLSAGLDEGYNFSLTKPQEVRLTISGTWVYLGMIDGKTLWQRVAD